MKGNEFNDKLNKLFETVKNNYSEISKACKSCEEQFLKAENDGVSYKEAYAQWELLHAIRGMVRSTENITSDFVSNFANNSYLKDYLHESLLLAAYRKEKEYSNYLLKHPEAKEVKVNEDTLNFLRMRITDIDLTVRTLNVMKVADINIVADIAIRNKKFFMPFRNFGKNSLKELEDVLLSYGLHFDYLLRYDEETKEYYTIA